MERIILASSSQRRKTLLTQIQVDFEIIPSYIDETKELGEQVSPYDAVKAISLKKAMHVCEQLTEPAIIIAADTVISLHGRIMGKPTDEQSAYSMLKLLQGKAHSVYTGVTLIKKAEDGIQLKNIVDTTTVFMRKLSEQEILTYIKTGEPYDKAGAYAIQEIGSVLIEKIEGDYYTVVGLPIVKVYSALKDFGVNLSQYWDTEDN